MESYQNRKVRRKLTISSQNEDRYREKKLVRLFLIRQQRIQQNRHQNGHTLTIHQGTTRKYPYQLRTPPLAFFFYIKIPQGSTVRGMIILFSFEFRETGFRFLQREHSSYPCSLEFLGYSRCAMKARNACPIAFNKRKNRFSIKASQNERSYFHHTTKFSTSARTYNKPTFY